MKANLILDFDSTFIRVESLELLAEIAMKAISSRKRDEILVEMARITNDGMTGKIGMKESLTKRLALFGANQGHLKELGQKLSKLVSPSIIKNKGFFSENSERIYIISGGFIDYMIPLLVSFGLLEKHIYGNSFRYSGENIVGFDEKNPLVESGGKVKVVKSLGLLGRSVMVGDGYTDYLVYKCGIVSDFLLFTENIRRSKMVDISKIEAKSFDEVLNFIDQWG